MSTDLLFEHFATLATATDGIARLRELILQLAIQGKLGTQDAGDEPAGVLLERITKAKERSVNEGKIKREKPIEPKCELAFQLPKSWVCTPLGAITSFEYGKSLPEIKREDSGKVPVFGSNGIVGYHSEAITKGPSLIIGRKGSVGAIQITNVPCHPIDTAYFIDNFENLDQFFLFYLLTSLKLESLDKSTAIPGLNRTDAYNLLIGLPPLAEQRRIVEKVDRLMALCDELEARQQKERAGCLRLGTASLAGLQNATHPEEFGRQWAQVCDAFDLILDCPENVAVLRQTILQLAVQGRLVRQEPGNEPAGKLVERIRKEKEQLKKEKKLRGETELSTITPEEIPFSTPTNWVWEKVGNISFVTKLAGFEYTKYISLKDHGEIPVIRAQNVRMGRIEKNNLKYIDLKTSECLERSALTKPAILMTFIGAGIGDVAIFWEKTRWHLVTNVAKIEPFNKYSENIDIKYFLLYLMSNTGREEIFKFRKSTAQPSLSMGTIREINIVLPPLAEQHRIVAKVDALMALCDALESRLKERAGVQGKMAGAVVKDLAKV